MVKFVAAAVTISWVTSKTRKIPDKPSTAVVSSIQAMSDISTRTKFSQSPEESKNFSSQLEARM